ncbi:ABC transporter ATP-binding protein [Georgenia sp. Z1344]|uniref:ABC transporter ATP-binding protein n=1 Tax=Georgenia sp. Z1344 TaxID=3416706 RepID=UPI003CF8DF8E
MSERHGPVPGDKPANFGGAIRRLLGEMRAERLLLVVVVLLGVLSVLLSVLGPRFLGDATDVVVEGFASRLIPEGVTLDQAIGGLRAVGQDEVADMLAGMGDIVPGAGLDRAELLRALAMALGVFAGAAMAMAANMLILNVVVQRVGVRLRAKVQAKVDAMPLAELDHRSRGDLLSRLTNDIDNITQALNQTMSQLITSVLTIVGVLAMMVWIDWRLAIVAVVTVPVSAAIMAIVAKRAQPHHVANWTATGEVGGTVEEAFTGHQLVQAFGAENEFGTRFVEQNDRLVAAADRSQFLSGTMMPLMQFVSNISYVLVAVFGVLRVSQGGITVGEVQAFVTYSRQFGQPIGQLAGMAALVQSGGASAERVFELLDADEMEPESSEPREVVDVRGDVHFEDVAFRYVDDVPLIDGLDLRARPGQTVAIVGRTGAGKTTLVNLLMRFYEVRGGRILVDGADTREMTRDHLRSHIGMVLQDTWLFEGTVAENIAYGRDGATREEVEEAGRAAGVERFVHSLPQGYDTMIEEDGGGVSAGERQLITIARAFLSDPAILVLDEATSSVDTRTEVLVQEAMGRLREGRTAFVIAHRLSTIRDADVILVMEAGAIVEQGAHAELLAAEGAYFRLYQSQFVGAMVGDANAADGEGAGAEDSGQ